MSTFLSSIQFTYPWALYALMGLPLLWLVLRATPPLPKTISFPGVRLLLETSRPDYTPAHTPWPVLLLRCLIAALVILAFAEPRERSGERLGAQGALIILFDGGWASAPDWPVRRALALAMLDEAARKERTVALLSLARKRDWALQLRPAALLRETLEALDPAPWRPDRVAFLEWLRKLDEVPLEAEIVYFRDGLDYGGSGAIERALSALGRLHVLSPVSPALALRMDGRDGEGLKLTALRAKGNTARTIQIVSREAATLERGRRILATTGEIGASETETAIRIDPPTSVANSIARMEISGAGSSGAVVLLDERSRRRRVALIAERGERDAARLLAPDHYLRTALRDISDLRIGDLAPMLAEAPEAIVFPDGRPSGEALLRDLARWVEDGGLLVRFAGPRLAASLADGSDAFLPVPLRLSGRAMGGALSWESPKKLRSFPEGSPFHGLALSDDIEARRQILAQPGAHLAGQAWAELTDGTPLVTWARQGKGLIVLFHVSANAEWSNLPLSGLFVQMLARLLERANGAQPPGGATGPDVLWRAEALLDAGGKLRPPPAAMRPLRGLPARAGEDAPPGRYRHAGHSRALNLIGEGETLRPARTVPPGARETLLHSDRVESWNLRPHLLLGALCLWFIDGLIALYLLRRYTAGAAMAAGLVLCVSALPSPQAFGQESPLPRAAFAPTLAYVRTGEPAVDRTSHAGLQGLGNILTARTTIEPASPQPVEPERDELAFYPLIYWPMVPSRPPPSRRALARLRDYMAHGGMLVIDTRDAHLGGAAGPGTQAFRRFAAALDLPPLQIAPEWHVIRRAFYLIDDFPGRWPEARLWVERSSQPVDQTVNPFAISANDGVSPIVIGGGDWAPIWAMDSQGRPLQAIPGASANQREIAWRFGVNLVMYAYAGNYKADQVHIPALLRRLEKRH